ncbi:MAG: sigma-70 family RNA polymerase sigma factor [Planctomycetota bacterium]
MSERVKTKDTRPSLLCAIKQMDPESWESFVDLYSTVIYARCRWTWQLNEESAREVSQDVFLVVSRKIPTFERRRTGSLRKWLRQIVDNKCRKFLESSSCPAIGGDRALSLMNDLPSVARQRHLSDQEYEKSERALLVNAAIQQIEFEFSDRDMNMFREAILNDRSRTDIASDFGVSTNVVYVAISRIRKRLKQQFQELLERDLIAENDLEVSPDDA